MKIYCICLGLILILFPSYVLAEDTPAQVPIGIAVGSNFHVEVSFPNMRNNQNCGYNGAFIANPQLSDSEKKSMLSLLLYAKSTNTPVRVRLSGCTDRPKFHYVFLDVNWL